MLSNEQWRFVLDNLLKDATHFDEDALNMTKAIVAAAPVMVAADALIAHQRWLPDTLLTLIRLR